MARKSASRKATQTKGGEPAAARTDLGAIIIQEIGRLQALNDTLVTKPCLIPEVQQVVLDAITHNALAIGELAERLHRIERDD